MLVAGFEQLDGVARRIVDQNLLPAVADRDVVAETGRQSL
jgi:hypothetical protein